MKRILFLLLTLVLFGCSDPRADDKEYVINYALVMSSPSAVERRYEGKVTARELAECLTNELSNQLDDDLSWAFFIDSLKLEDDLISSTEFTEKYSNLDDDELDQLDDKMSRAMETAEVNCNPLKQ